MNFPMIDTYEAQVICLFEYYPKEIIQLIKKYKNVLKKNNFNINFFLKIMNRKSSVFEWHIQKLATTQIARWYRGLKTKKCIEEFVKLKKINPFSNIKLNDYYIADEKVFDFLALKEDIDILNHLYQHNDDSQCEFDDSIETEYLEEEEEVMKEIQISYPIYYPLDSSSDDEYTEDFDEDTDIEEDFDEETDDEENVEEMDKKENVVDTISYYEWFKSFFI
jgi:hypothetical protein